MKIPVLIQWLDESGGWRASNGEPFGCSAEGTTPYEAVQKLRQVIEARIKAGAVLVHLDVPLHENQAAASGGVYKDNPLFEEWQQAIEEYRRQCDEDPNRL